MTDTEQDFLEVDAQIRGQDYCCISFVSPEEKTKMLCELINVTIQIRFETFLEAKFPLYITFYLCAMSPRIIPNSVCR